MHPNITTPHYELYEDNFETHQNVPNIDDDVNLETGDTYIGAEVSLPHGDSQQTGKVICQARDQDSELTGTAHNNPCWDLTTRTRLDSRRGNRRRPNRTIRPTTPNQQMRG